MGLKIEVIFTFSNANRKFYVFTTANKKHAPSKCGCSIQWHHRFRSQWHKTNMHIAMLQKNIIFLKPFIVIPKGLTLLVFGRLAIRELKFRQTQRPEAHYFNLKFKFVNDVKDFWRTSDWSGAMTWQVDPLLRCRDKVAGISKMKLYSHCSVVAEELMEMEYFAKLMK